MNFDYLKKPVLAYKNNVFIERFESGTDAAKKLSLLRSKVSSVLRNKRNHTGGYVFIFDL